MLKVRVILAVVCVWVSITLNSSAQEFYDISHIPEIRITFAQDNWDEILDQLYVDGAEERLLCSVEIEGTLIEGAGIRYKGFSSVSVDYIKNPFNIKLDYSVPGTDYQGFDKIKLSNVIQDPSFVREVLSYEIARNYMPSGRANFAKLFINGEYWGLYTNVEAVNKEFLAEHFFSTDGPFFKCNPSELDLFGENANLSDTPGTSEEDYEDLYDIKSDYGWTELVEFIQTLNNSPENIETYLNVDRALWMHALNYSFINFDSYVGYGQNYYLYQDENGQFNPILWDMNMSFGSFRLTDASEFFDGFSVLEAQTIDPLTHLNNVSVFPRPLMRNLFENSTYERMYIAHLRTIFEEYFFNGLYEERAQSIQDLIDQDVLADENKFYGYDDFLDNLNTTVTDLIQYPGITDLMENRSDYIQNYPGISGAPDFLEIVNYPPEIAAGDNLIFNCEISEADEVFLFYRYDSGLFQKVQMTNLGEASFETTLENTSSYIEYYFYAQNETAGRFSPERAAYEYYSLQSSLIPESLVINEIAPINASHPDPNGEYDDWIELYNLGPNPVNTAGLYLTDDSNNLFKWALPNLTLDAEEYVIIWADEQGSQGSRHANFKLSSEGEFLGLFASDGTAIDSLTYGAINENSTWARVPNGEGPFVENTSSIGYSNDPNSILKFEDLYHLYPNPANNLISIQTKTPGKKLLEIHNLFGEKVLDKPIKQSTSTVDISGLASGMYFLVIESDEKRLKQKLIII